jgi:hypothetical protein
MPLEIKTLSYWSYLLKVIFLKIPERDNFCLIEIP